VTGSSVVMSAAAVESGCGDDEDEPATLERVVGLLCWSSRRVDLIARCSLWTCSATLQPSISATFLVKTVPRAQTPPLTRFALTWDPGRSEHSLAGVNLHRDAEAADEVDSTKEVFQARGELGYLLRGNTAERATPFFVESR